MKISGAEVMVNALEKEGVKTVFGYPGAAICPLYDNLYNARIRHILTRHEQGAAHAANGFARASGEVGVCIATSGPGATNLITGIATAYLDSIPVVAITGQVKLEQIGKDVFQEVDIRGAVEPFIKHSYFIESADDVSRVVKEAFYIAKTGRPGPVLIDFPVDVQRQMTDVVDTNKIEIRGYNPPYEGDLEKIKEALSIMANCKRPVICAGGGVVNAYAKELLKSLIDTYKVPVTTTLMGIGALEKDNPYNLGMLGSHGQIVANYAIHHADALFVFGARVGDRAMGKVTKLSNETKLIHVDIDPAEIGKNLRAALEIVGDIKKVLETMVSLPKETPVDEVLLEREEWINELMDRKQAKKYDYEGLKAEETIKPQLVLKELSKRLSEDDIVTTEVGQNQIWAANHLDIKKERKFISSGGLGTMGYGLPSALGAKAAMENVTVVNISGDGSFQMSIQELATIVGNNLDIKILLFNNDKLGMVRELQRKQYCERYCATCLEGSPDFTMLAKAYGIDCMRISKPSEIENGLDAMLKTDRAFILEVIIDKDEDTLW